MKFFRMFTDPLPPTIINFGKKLQGFKAIWWEKLGHVGLTV